MNNFYLYKFNYKQIKDDFEKSVSATVIFCDREDILEDNLKEEIKKFYQVNYQTDKIFVIGGDYLKPKLIDVFITDQDKTFIHIPKRQETFLKESLYVLTFNKNGDLSCANGKTIPTEFLISYQNEGLQNIFIKGGGLVTSQGAHHFVFPSGKHCDKFLRVGNILLVSSEIYFIAFSLLRHFDEEAHNQIYCDTSSINSVAFALTELKNRFVELSDRRQISIESFSSYDGLYKNELSYNKNAFLIISASTSSNIISYILDHHGMIDRNNIVIMYYLGKEKNYSNIKDKVICNLTHHENYNVNGIPFYDTYKEDDCEHCAEGSYPVQVSGDVFLLEKPYINRVVFNVNDAEKNLSTFVNQFKSYRKTQCVLKTNYKERSSFKYDVYINFNEILLGIKGSRYPKYKTKLNNYINQYIPSNTKYIVSLNDIASEDLANYILEKISHNYLKKHLPKLKRQDNLPEIKADEEGTIVVVGSCISNGKNLLYISRALRRFDKFRIVYFIGISRTRNREYLNQLKSNLKQGSYGAESNSFIEVETIYCNSNSRNTPWLAEIEFLKKFIEFLKNDEERKTIKTQDYFTKRKGLLQKSGGKAAEGLSEDLFFPQIIDSKKQPLSIRKGFAYFNFEKYDEHVSQSDIYFTISNVINSIRNSDKRDRNLKQSVYVRNLISPANFNRFNDGIIQACILRAAYPEELAYGIDEESSQDMTNTLETIIKYYKNEQGEALIEFLYAIATKKMSLKKIHLKKILELIDDKCYEEIILFFSSYIRKNVYEEKKYPPLKKLKPVKK